VVKNAEVERMAVGVWELRCFEVGFMEVRYVCGWLVGCDGRVGDEEVYVGPVVVEGNG